MHSLESEVHSCRRCKKKLSGNMPYPPVYSFGDPNGKTVILVGINPSRKEFEEGFLSTSKSIEDRRYSQLSYFDRSTTTYFAKVAPFFNGAVKGLLGWEKSPWEKIGVLDLVKCTTIGKNGQWSKMGKYLQDHILGNCEEFLIKQLRIYRPRILIPYGVPVCEWFAEHLSTPYYEYESFKVKLDGLLTQGIFIPQRQGNHSKPEIQWVQRELAAILRSL